MQRRFLLRSRWTALVPLDDSAGERHFEVKRLEGDEVIVWSVLSQREYRIAISALQDPSAWATGWVQLG